MDEKRSFDEKETALILSRAAELSRPSPGDSALDRRETTLDELERIAGEAGIAPELVREAAAEIASRGRRSFGRTMLGGATRRALTFDVAGRVSKETLERALLELPRVAGGTGTGFVSPDGLTWSSGADTSRSAGYVVSVEVRTEDQRTTVEIAENRAAVAVGLFAGIAGGMGLGVGLPLGIAVGVEALGLGAWGVLLGLAPVAVAWLSCRFGYASFARKRDKKLEKLRADLRRVLEKRGPSGLSEPPSHDAPALG